MQSATSYHAFSDPAADDAPHDALWGRPARPHVLLASLGVAAATFIISGASMLYAFTHIPEVDPDADPAPVAAVAAVAAEAPATPAKLEVLTPPVYAGTIDEAPAITFVPLSARAHMDTATIDAVDPYKRAQADGQTGSQTEPCAEPCSAQAGYVVEPASHRTVVPVRAAAADVEQDDDDAKDSDDDGNAPPPPGVVVN